MAVHSDSSVQLSASVQTGQARQSGSVANSPNQMIDQGFGVLLQQWVDLAIRSTQQVMQPSAQTNTQIKTQASAPAKAPEKSAPTHSTPTLQPGDLPGFESTVQKFLLK